MGHYAVLLVILLCYDNLFVGMVQSTRSLSKGADLDKEIHKKLLNKPSIKNIQYGGVYDCVNVYEQEAFDRPSLQNNTIDFRVISTMVQYKASERDSSTIGKSSDSFLRSETCPVGTIPIPRISKVYLNEKETANSPNIYLAVARTKMGHGRYSGASGYVRVDKLKIVGQQFSATRISLQTGTDRIEAGWRVDPSLYGDSRTRFYIRTDAGRTHCFNIRCPGFIQRDRGFNFNDPIDVKTIPGGPIYAEHIRIIKDNRNGNWNLLMGDNPTLIGFWPSHIFTNLTDLADRIEWGGAAYSPPGTPLPPMGSGNRPIGNTSWDGFISQTKVLNEKGQKIDAFYLETYADNPNLYSALDNGYQGKYWGRLILYGGSGH